MSELKKYLRINSAFSLVNGLTMLLFTEQLNVFFNIENPYVFLVIGGNLIIFSIFVWYVSKRQLRNKIMVNVITILDVLWVVSSATIILFGLFDLSKNGNIVIGLVAVWIGFLGFKQYQNNK